MVRTDNALEIYILGNKPISHGVAFFRFMHIFSLEIAPEWNGVEGEGATSWHLNSPYDLSFHWGYLICLLNAADGDFHGTSQRRAFTSSNRGSIPVQGFLLSG